MRGDGVGWGGGVGTGTGGVLPGPGAWVGTGTGGVLPGPGARVGTGVGVDPEPGDRDGVGNDDAVGRGEGPGVEPDASGVGVPGADTPDVPTGPGVAFGEASGEPVAVGDDVGCLPIGPAGTCWNGSSATGCRLDSWAITTPTAMSARSAAMAARAGRDRTTRPAAGANSRSALSARIPPTGARSGSPSA